MKTSFLAMILTGALLSPVAVLCAADPSEGDSSLVASADSAAARELSVSERERLDAAELARRKWMEHLENSQSVDETIRAKEELDKINREIRGILEGRDLDRGQTLSKEELQHKFKNVETRDILYGPIGIVLELTEWILRKLYLWRTD